MHYDLLKPCSTCPFLRKGGVRLKAARVEQIAGMMLSPNGGTFACHKTTKASPDGDEMLEVRESRHCAGALMFSEKNGNATQAVRIAERLGMYDARKLMSDQAALDSVFDSVDEMLEVNERCIIRPKRKRVSRKVKHG